MNTVYNKMTRTNFPEFFTSQSFETFSLDSRSKYVVIGQLGNKLKFGSDTFQEIPHAVTFAHTNLLVRGT
jgi:hypothetical protein